MAIRSTITAIGFWLGALLPVAYLPVFLAGLDSMTRVSVFVALLVLNVVALVVGHDYPGTRHTNT